MGATDSGAQRAQSEGLMYSLHQVYWVDASGKGLSLMNPGGVYFSSVE